jgi:hypothetical protein
MNSLNIKGLRRNHPLHSSVEDQTYEESLHEEDIVEEESIHSSTQEDKCMVSCNHLQISEFYDTSSCDLEREDVEETSFDEEHGIDAHFLGKA